MFAQMVRAHLESDFGERTAKKITPDQYLEWEKNYCFDGLRSLTPGQSFCSTFKIVDHILFFNAIDPTRVVKYIKDTYLE
jgi:hypothetical protein